MNLKKIQQWLLGPYRGDEGRYASTRKARKWSDVELRKFAPHYQGDVINVSAWRDEDKEGGHYKDYFTNAKSYSISNLPGGWRADDESCQGSGAIPLNLEEPLPRDLSRSFDVVFNHTTLEHVFQFTHAFGNLCSMTRDTVILVVPFIQHLHGPDDGDFWRPSPYCLRRLFRQNDLTVLYESASPIPEVVYLFFVASRKPELWQKVVPHARILDPELGRV